MKSTQRSPRAARGKSGSYALLKAGAQAGTVTVADVFLNMRRGKISEEECRDILLALERAKDPRWQRALKMFVS